MKVRIKVKSLHIVIAVFLLTLLFSYFNTFEKLEYLVQDSLFQKGSDIDTRVVIIAIDDESLEHLGRWPWPREYHAQLINTLAKGNPAVIFLDLIFSEPSTDPAVDENLAEAIKNFGRVIVPSFGIMNKIARGGLITASQLTEPIPILKEVSLRGHINTFQDSDGLVRRTLLYLEHNGEKIESAALKAYKTYIETVGGEDHSDSIPVDEWGMMYIHYAGEAQSIEHHSYYKILNGEIPPEYFENKIVLVGPYAVGIGDFYPTPVERRVPMYGIEIHANIVHNLLNGNFKQKVNFAFTIAILLVFGLLGIFAFNRLSPGKSIILLFFGIFLYLAVAFALYNKGYILPVIYPLLFYFILSYI